MSDPRPASKIVIERARPSFGPSGAARERMRAELHRRILAQSTSSLEAPPPLESGTRLAMKGSAGKVLAIALLVLAAGAWTVSRDLDPVDASTNAHVDEARSAPAECMAPACTAPLPPPLPIADGVVSAHDLPDVPGRRDRLPPLDARGAEAPPARFARVKKPLPSLATEARASENMATADVAPVQATPLESDALSDELRLVRDAQAAFAKGDLARAHRSLDAHNARFPHGMLREDRLVLRVLLLCAEGDTQRALRAAEELVSTHPRSSHFYPLRTSCASAALP
ncbi:MAG: hypothetical protein BGO98_38020 [Myxococcales bacterium 68-20]|nr:hypothetical protein [Myxococcales bacterium]OJY14848.1 MAG: hypothetical protein BGO98_38020 [Myxococcales bacterium 68-20]